MKDAARVRVAAVVAAASLGEKIRGIYDCSSSQHRNAFVAIAGGRVRGYDHSTSSAFSGSSGTLNFYDYDTGKHVHLALDGTTFSGYDCASQKPFSGRISGSSISLCDGETGIVYSFRA